MKRFLLVIALVGVAGATYVATAPGSQTAGPSAKQFRALQKDVKALKKQMKSVEFLTYVDTTVLIDCMAKAQPIAQRGDTSVSHAFGYSYADPTINGGTPFLTTALDFAAIDDPNALWVTGGTSQCGTDINGSLRHARRLLGHLQRVLH
jgi:hypothetical protein